MGVSDRVPQLVMFLNGVKCVSKATDLTAL